MTRNDDAFSFVDREKESFRERLVKLIGNRSVRTAASDWGIPPSTLNNYIHKGTEPSFKIACLISDKEQVSLNWLAYGEEPIAKESSLSNQTAQPSPDITNELVNELLKRASTEDKEQLISAICDMGIKGILERLQQPTRQTKQADSELEEQRKAIQSLNIRQSLKDAVCMALAGDEENDKEILRRAKAIFCAGTPGDRVPVTPEQETKPVNKKSA
ncbi:helix-turn-helix domain-containing protein [Escherichia coli]|uniref:helix-turn-helix domain-containing protein n=1 Tax=Escherichia coli TaxID=562 RepID=UPI000510A2C9|nr:helix-turn-helix domain-containing protein [Escherichia coli]ELD9329947.1 helix-turn-helix domain-containing protein [Salmonella enterica]EEX2906870.1 XRE family transcriptional regulator [Escherichia coli]EFB8894307.1 XRE family transcriptional regulator [Escherichia coli]EFE8666210.1 bacteriophage CI repressor [Escherichia coli]EFH5500161.1 XRE family transcriptional regulator [Escherichia coli]